MGIRLGRVLKVISTILIAVGIAYLFLFVTEQNRSATDILDQPSYYVVQNYKMLFLAGIAAVAFSVLGSFFSWSEKIDPKEQVLMNAGYTSAENIETWLKGSTAEEGSRELRGTTNTVTENTAGRGPQGSAAPGTGMEQLGYAMPQAAWRPQEPVTEEPMTEEAHRELEQTFSKPFVSPSTVVVDFKPSEVIKKVDEIAEPEAEPEVVPESGTETVAEPGPDAEAVPETEVEPEPEPAPEPEAVPETEVEPEPESEEEEEAAITETLDDEEEEKEAAITETLDDDDEETAITETLEDDSTGKEADA